MLPMSNRIHSHNFMWRQKDKSSSRLLNVILCIRGDVNFPEIFMKNIESTILDRDFLGVS